MKDELTPPIDQCIQVGKAYDEAKKREVKTLRDEFAMAALTGMLADPNVTADFQMISKSCYEAADCMMIERGNKA